MAATPTSAHIVPLWYGDDHHDIAREGAVQATHANATQKNASARRCEHKHHSPAKQIAPQAAGSRQQAAPSHVRGSNRSSEGFLIKTRADIIILRGRVGDVG